MRPTLIHAVLLLSATAAAHAQAKPDARALVAAAVESELNANRTDHTPFLYRDHDITPDHDTLAEVVETPDGNLRRVLEDHGHPLTAAQRTADDQVIQTLIASPALQLKQRQSNAKDDQQAESFLKLLPVAYLWTIVSEHDDLVTLDFHPDPAFAPASMEDRVLSALAGQIVISLPQKRIRTFKGALQDDVKFGYGLFGRMRRGGGFQIERREVAPHHWQITESHVHILGKALFFKAIGDEEDEVKTDFHISPARNFQQAEQLLTQHP